MTRLGCAHVDSPTKRELFAVKFGSHVHYVRKGKGYTERANRSFATLCDQLPKDALGKGEWRGFVKSAEHLGGAVCMTCRAEACVEPSIVVFPYEKR